MYLLPKGCLIEARVGEERGSRPSRWCNWAGGHRLPWFGSGGLQGKRRLAADLVGAEACHGLERHVAVLELPLVVLLHQDGPDDRSAGTPMGHRLFSMGGGGPAL